MTEDKHMQKAREVGIDIRVASKLRWPREASRLWATADAIEDMDELIATALSEAYRSGVEEERERAALVLEKAASDGDAVADKLGNGEAKRHLVGEGNLLRVLADAIRKP